MRLTIRLLLASTVLGPLLLTLAGSWAATPDSTMEAGKAAGTIPTVIFGPFGARGNASFDDRCPVGQYIVGLHVRSGAWMDQLGVICAAVSSTGAVSGNHSLPAHGGNGGGPSERTCGSNQVVSAMRFRMTRADRQVKEITMDCRATTGSGTGAFTIGASANDGNIGSFRRQNCPAGDAATGIQGRYGTHVNAIGLICSRLVLPRPPVAGQPGHCPEGQILYSNGKCGCPSGMRGAKCDEIIVH
jgi:hypothetical protein